MRKSLRGMVAEMTAPATFARIATLHQALADAYATLAAEPSAPAPERVVGLAEAAQRLGMSRAWLSRRANWQRAGGWLGDDRRVHFTMAGLEAYVRAHERA